MKLSFASENQKEPSQRRARQREIKARQRAKERTARQRAKKHCGGVLEKLRNELN